MAETFVWETPEEIDRAMAQRLRKIRKRKGFSQQKLSGRSNVSLGSVKRFESTGQISLLSLTKLAVALGCENELRELFTNVPDRNIEEVLRGR